jgi:hypothetical protein
MTIRSFAEFRRSVRSDRRSFAIAVAGLLPLVLSSCGGAPIQPGAMVKTVQAEEAMVMPPPSGPGIVGVIERRYDNAIEQEIPLFTSALTPGQNFIKAQFFGTESAFRYSSNRLTSKMVSQSGTASEMASAFPGVRMVRSQFYVQNSYGPFGYAFGRGRGSDLCLYGWQQIRSQAQKMSPVNNYGSIQIRVRICEAGATEQALLAFMYNFTINASVDSLGWNPYGDVTPLSPEIGRTGSPTYPRPASTEAIVPVLPQRQAGPTIQRAAPAAIVRPAVAPVSSSVMEPVIQPVGPRIPSVSALSSAGRDPSLPSDPALSERAQTPAARSRVTVPSPSCLTQAEGTDVVCR